MRSADRTDPRLWEKPPLGSEQIWALYHELNFTREQGFSSMGPLTQREIRAYQFNMRRRLSPFQIMAIIALDTARRSVFNQHRREQDESK